MENTLQRSEEYYRQLTDLSPNAIVIHSEGKFVFVNPAAVKLFGAKRPKELIGKPVVDIIHPNYREIIIEQIKKIMEEGKEVPLTEEKFIRLDGKVIDVEVTAIPFTYQGKPAVLAIGNDITERKQAGEAFRESKKRYRTLIDSVPIGIGVHQDGKWVLVNKATLDLLGYDKEEELIGKPALEILYPDYREFAAKSIQKIAKTGKPAPPAEEKVLKKDGSIIHALISSTPITFKGKLAFQVAAVDITALKEAQQEVEKRQQYLESVLNDAPDAIVTLDNSHRILEWNPGAQMVFGYTRNETLGKYIDDLITREDVSDEAMALTKQVLSGKQVLPRETVRYRKDGTPVDVIVAGSPIQIEGELHGVVAVYSDITKRKQAEKALQESEKRYRDVVENATDIIFVNDLEGNINFSNPAGARITGYSLDELIGMNFKNLVHQDDQDRIGLLYEEQFKKRTNEIKYECRIMTKSGKTIWGEIHSTLLIKDDRVMGWQSIGRDITDRKRAEEEIRSWQKRYETIVEATGQIIYEWDLENNSTVWSGSIEAVLGYTRDEFATIGDAWSTCIHPDDFQRAKRIIQEAIKGSASEVEVEYRFRHKDGIYKHILDRALIIRDEKRKAIKSLGSMTDITTQKEAEKAASEAQRLQNVLYRIADTTSTAKDLADLFSAIHSYLSTVIDTTNFYIAFYDVEKDLVSFPYFIDEIDTPPTASLPIGRGLTAYLLRRGKSLCLTKGEMKELARRGEIEIVGTPSEIWLGVPLKVENQSVGAVVVQSYEDCNLYSEKDLEILEFVSDQIANAIVYKRAEEAVRRSEEKYRTLSEELSEANNMKELLLDVITHDLKNPAGVISGMTEIMAEENPEDETILLVKNSSDNLLKVIENATTLARITLHEEIEKEELDLAEVIEQVSSVFSPSLKSKGMTLENHISEALPVLANPIIAEVFSNYISNAIKYSADGKRIVIDAEKSDDFMTIAVSDFGRSIPKKNRLRIFERTIQLDSDAKSGRGLGLAIVKRIAEAHGGKVWVEPIKPKGNIFYFKIPGY